MISLGLDLSATAPGVAVLRKEHGVKVPVTLLAEKIAVPKADQISRWDRVLLIRDHVASVVNVHQPSVIAIEGYGQVSHGGVQSFVKVVEVGTLVRLVFHAQQMKWLEVPPSSLKKFVTGRGRGVSKKEMISGVRDQWGFETKSHDVADAWGLAAFALAFRGQLSLNKAQMDVLDGLRSGGG